MHSEISSLTSNYTELIYRNFESSLNERTDCLSTIIKAVKPPWNKLSAYTGKYFKPYPEIRQENMLLMENKNTQQKKITLLPNGSLCPAVVVENHTYFLQNTCSFDSVVQVLATAGIDNVQ
ncbi:unnamed protein product [Lasius platythorax]|uniref:Uncharacterized protein n=1 Tax=Lasius platythorax TaxID=488582 RepID=A0AAV2MX96_9HYME